MTDLDAHPDSHPGTSGDRSAARSATASRVGRTPPTPAQKRRRARRLSLRGAVGVTLLAVWTVATATGVLLYVSPSGRRSGQLDILAGLTKETWGEIHWWVSLAAVVITVVHLVLDWNTFKVCVRHLTHTDHGHASARPCSDS